MKTSLGIIGKGGLVCSFFDYLAQSDSAEFVDQFSRIVFLNERYSSEADFRKSGNFPEIEENIAGLGELELKVERRFSTFAGGINILVDASGPNVDGKGIPPTLFAHSKFLLGAISKEPQLDLNADYAAYQAGGAGKKLISKKEFEEGWEFSRRLLDTINDVHSKFPIGLRSVTLLPFSIPMMLARGRKLQEFTKLGIALPTYINLVNEPCTTSTILASQCPEITPYLVSCTGYDVERLEIELNETFQGVKERVGYGDKRISVSMKGFHDREVMVPVIYPQIGADQEAFIKVFGEVEYTKMFDFLQKRVGAYWDNHNPHDGKEDHRDVQQEVNQTLLNTILNAAKSRGRELSLFPNVEERALCNGFYQEGNFLVGNHRFKGGRVVHAR